MQKEIKERFNEDILDEAMRRYDIAGDKIRLLDGFESFIYEFERGGDEYILRIGHSLRRNENLIHGEVDWINYLAAGGASVASAIFSKDDRLVEMIDDGRNEHFLAAAFVKAEGQPPQDFGWTPALFETYGRTLGKIHALSKEYMPGHASWQRPHWDDELMLDIERNLPASETAVLEKFHAVVAHLKNLPKDKDSYGMIHFDAHGGNFFVDRQGQITLFDFDDCSYAWFAYDIAIALFYMVTGLENASEFSKEFMRAFLRGYSREQRLEPKWLQEIPYFLKLREIDLYAVIHRSFDVSNIENPWCACYMQGRKERIERDVPYIDFDFESLGEYV